MDRAPILYVILCLAVIGIGSRCAATDVGTSVAGCTLPRGLPC